MNFRGIHQINSWMGSSQMNWMSGSQRELSGKYEMMRGTHSGLYWVFTLFRGVIGFILPLILLYLIYRFLKKKEGASQEKYETALERLKMRLVKGEITKEEYEELKKIIE